LFLPLRAVLSRRVATIATAMLGPAELEVLRREEGLDQPSHQRRATGSKTPLRLSGMPLARFEAIWTAMTRRSEAT
jgi:hypothetical protein